MSSNHVSGNSHILLTGGTGFIGVPLVQHLQALGYHVWVVTRQPDKARARLGADVSCVAQLMDLPEIPFRAVINLAGEPLASGRWSPSRKALFRSSRIGSTAALFEFFQRRKSYPPVLVSGSAIGIYGDCGDRLITEVEPAGKDFSAELCKDWEQSAQVFADCGTRVCLLRTGIALGQGGGVLAKMLPAFRMGLGGNLGDGQQWMSWVHRQDLIRLIVFCVDNQQLSGPLNGVALEAVTNDEFTRTLGRVLHRPTLIPIPRWLLRILFGEMAEALMLASQRIIPQVATRHGFVFEYSTLENALKNIFDKE
jgi:hypothetical protein